MKWKVIRLELASSWQFPRGSAGRSYLIRLPLADGGEIDATALASQPMRATVRRYWPNEADMVGHLVRTPGGFAIKYELNGSAMLNGGPKPIDDLNQQLFSFSPAAIKEGEEISLTEPDGHQVRYRVANLH